MIQAPLMWPEERQKTIGKNKAGELVAEFFITWSFKAKPPIPKGEYGMATK